MNVICKIKRIGRFIEVLDNDFIGFRHSANLYIELIQEKIQNDPFSGMHITAYCGRKRSKNTILCPLEKQDDKTYILLNTDVFTKSGEVYLSLAAIDEENIVITSNNLVLKVDDSNKIKAAVSPPEEYWQREVLSAMKSWYTSTVDPYFEKSKEKLDDLIDQTNESQKDVKNAVAQCYDAISALQLETFDMDGGDPFTQASEDDIDVNGGYPI